MFSKVPSASGRFHPDHTTLEELAYVGATGSTSLWHSQLPVPSHQSGNPETYVLNRGQGRAQGEATDVAGRAAETENISDTGSGRLGRQRMGSEPRSSCGTFEWVFPTKKLGFQFRMRPCMILCDSSTA